MNVTALPLKASLRDGAYVGTVDLERLVAEKTHCDGCGRPFETGARKLLSQMASGRVTGIFHRRCQQRRRQEVSGPRGHRAGPDK